MSSCDSSGEDYMGRRLRQLQQDYNQRKYVGWDTEEEIAARKAEMERSVRKEVKIVTAQQEGGPSNPIMVGFFQPQYDLSLKLSDRKSTRLNSSHVALSRMPSSACKKKK